MGKVALHPGSSAPPSNPLVPGTKRGPFVYTSGQVGRDAAGNLIGKGDIRAQTRQTLENVKAVLEEGGASLGDVMKVTVFLADIGERNGMNEVYKEYFGDDPPARSAIEVALGPDILVEIEAVAVISD